MNLRQNNFLSILILAVSLSGMWFHVSASAPAEIFDNANKAYMDQKYEEAIKLYEQLVNSNKVSFEVYYNLGNAYYKTGSIAPSILNYERARLLKPSDADVNYNLRIAYLATIDKIEPAPMVFYEKWWNDFVNGGSVQNRAVSTAVLFWISLLFAAGYLFLVQRSVRKIMFFAALASITAGFFMLYLTSLQHRHLNNKRAAIIFTESTYVKSSPDDNSANLFMLHGGTRIDVIDQLKSWKKIRIANGNEGWVLAESVEII